MRLQRSLKWKVVPFLTLLVLGTVLLTGWVINQTLDQKFKQYLQHSHEAEVQEILTGLGEIYLLNKGWQNLTENASVRRWLFTTPIVKLEDAQGRTVFAPNRIRRRFQRALDNRRAIEYPLLINEYLVGKAWILGPTPAGFLTQTDLAFKKAVNQATLISSILLGSFALFLGFLAVRPHTKRLNHLQAAVSALTAGDLSTRVERKTQDELGILAENFNKMADQLEQLEKVRQNYLRETAHELRTPLTTIRSHIEAFIDGVIPPDQESLLRVQTEILNLISLIDNLQELVSFSGRRNNLKTSLIELNTLLANLIDQFRPLCAKYEIPIQLHLPAEPLSIKTDSAALTKVLNNLLMNAIKFSSPGKQITVCLEKAGTEGKISVTDQGIGIHREDLPKIFHRFYRVDPSRSRKTGGTGLGLAIVKELTTELGGQIEVSSQPKQGSTFTLTLPLPNA